MTTLSLFAREPSQLVETSDLQCTPRDLALELGRFGLDPCSNPLSHILADRTCMLEHGQDGLSDPWTVDGITGSHLASVWCNGEYSDPLPWCERLRAHQAPWTALWKLDTTTGWWRTLVSGSGATWAPFRKRVAFEKAGNVGVANFCSVLVWRDWEPPAAVLARLWAPRVES